MVPIHPVWSSLVVHWALFTGLGSYYAGVMFLLVTKETATTQTALLSALLVCNVSLLSAVVSLSLFWL